MISSVFVDRPRLAIVIALVTVVAGLVSLLAIPIAQYPDIVPPQVSVTTSYPPAPPPAWSNRQLRSRLKARSSASTRRSI